jgi:nucleoside-diphosphate-sugar epimerase
MKPMRVALLGATSHIAKGLIACWSQRQDRELLLYARSPERVREFMTHLEPSRAEVFSISEFGNKQYDVVVNCVGIGSPQKLKDNLEDIFRITASFDDLVLDYLAGHTQTLYVNLSSGAAYGTDFSQPVDEQSQARFSINDLKPEEFYGIAKLHAEARHRALPRLNIVDLRIFGYFSRYIDLNEKFLLSEIITSVQNGQEFVTGPSDIVRDFVHPQDLLSLIQACMGQTKINDVYDVYSAKPATKFEIIEYFTDHHGLKCRVESDYTTFSVTGTKDSYISNNKKANIVGYTPQFSSLNCISQETAAILKQS